MEGVEDFADGGGDGEGLEGGEGVKGFVGEGGDLGGGDFEEAEGDAVAGDDVAVGLREGVEVGDLVGGTEGEAEKALAAGAGFPGEKDFRAPADEEGVFFAGGENGAGLFFEGFRGGGWRRISRRGRQRISGRGGCKASDRAP